MNKCVLYLRVSTDEEKQDVNNQREPLIKLAQALELEIVKEYIDHASGGNSNRPQFQQMLEDSRSQRVYKCIVPNRVRESNNKTRQIKNLSLNA